MPLMLTGCLTSGSSEIPQVGDCRALITQSLVSPSTTTFIEHIVVHDKAAQYRDPKTDEAMAAIRKKMEALQSGLGELHDMEAIRRSEAQREDVTKELDQVKTRIAAHEAYPYSGVFFELDSPNRAGVMLRLVGACTWDDTQGPEVAKSSFELLGVTEGRIPDDMRQAAAEQASAQ